MKYKLEEIADIYDSLHQTPSYIENGISMVRVTDLSEGYLNLNKTLKVSEEIYNEFTKKYVPKNNDIIMSRVGTYGVCVLVNTEEKFCLGQNTVIISPKQNKRFLYYYLMSSNVKEQIEGFVTGSTQKTISLKNIKNIIIDLPSDEQQERIANVLDNITQKIELNNQINDHLFEMCNTIYHNYLDKYSELIENKKIVEIANRVVTGKTPSTKNEDFWNGNIPFITIPDMHNQVFTINTERKISNIGAKALIPKNSISVSCIATVGLVSISTEESQTNQQINSIVLNNDYDLYYLFEFLSEQENFMKNIAGGSTTYNINKNTFENIEVPYLPTDKLIEFHNIVSKMFEKIKLNQLENKNLEQLRDTLLPKLMNGEIDLDKIEI